ncbi:hypothetical protein KAT92_05540, partial [Candidatus Babeliales bacterium]|nr:hypothetical protein [Candidatus Babeliales bacterium]
ILKISIALKIPPDDVMARELAGVTTDTKFSRTADVHPRQLAEHFGEAKYILPSPEYQAELSEQIGLLDNAMETLTFREREVLKLRYGLSDGYTYGNESLDTP